MHGTCSHEISWEWFASNKGIMTFGLISYRDGPNIETTVFTGVYCPECVEKRKHDANYLPTRKDEELWLAGKHPAQREVFKRNE